MKNNLINDSSPYLQQHKNNPVNWQTWNKETLSLAKSQKKPILLSVGYASCHWCHVMAHESFEDKETADLMNKLFINIKVDREERPDLDFIFQSAYQLFNQTGGGWPLTMFLDENGFPFMGGTYFPKIRQHGLPSFKEVLEKVGEAYSQQKDQIIKQSSIITKSLELKKTSVLNQDLEQILENTLNNLDEVKGGYKGSPKFPIFNVYDTLLYFFNKTKNNKYLQPVELILKQLCSQGIYDHVEGGISRYTVDENWLIPHFEKMLYDNAQFILLLSKYTNVKKNEYFESKIVQTIEFINKNFTTKINGILGSAYDADSEGEEGKYYVFAYKELKDIKNLDSYFEIKLEGNWEGKIILKEKNPPTEEILKQLKKIRQNKTKPFFDNKNQLDLNALWVSALVSAHKILPNNGYLNTAEDLFDKLENFFLKDELFHSNSKKKVFIEDYAYSINMLLDLYDRTLKPDYIIKAKNICSKAIKHFYVNKKAIFQKNKLTDNDLFLQPIDITDHTIPNGNSIMLLNFSRLGMKKEGKELSDSLNGYLNVYKALMISSLKSIDYFNTILSGKNCSDEGCDI
ncbi:MAG: thioredoxin domain-containing protein [Candidatus Pelagibacter sp. TMED165]|nr:MAG: thioredoxin domain-containing protein [Candidatus Pelagibacter sp. TMED165]|tara:strand:+ start:274 stop:1989 length:1716 start_codon:yes stop_codon:yes gene_type:complete